MNLPRRAPRIDTQIENWLEHLKASSYSEESIRSYGTTVRQWHESGQTPMQFLSHLVSEGRSNVTVRARRTGLRAFLAWQVDMGYSRRNQLANSKAPRTDQKQIRPLTIPQVARLLEGCENLYRNTDEAATDRFGRMSADAYRARLAAMVAVQVSSGLRVGELLHLRDSDLKLSKREGVCRGKGRKERPFRIGRPAARAVRRWLEVRDREVADPQVLFCTSNGTAIDPPVYREQLAAACYWDDSLPKVHPHLLRHTFATNAAMAGTPVQDLAQMLGHSNIMTTMRYIHEAQGRRAWDALEERLAPSDEDATLVSTDPQDDGEEDTNGTTSV